MLQINKIKQMKYFEYIFCSIILIISILGWQYNFIVGISMLIIISATTLILFNDIKLSIPCIINTIFLLNIEKTNNITNLNQQNYLSIIILGSIYFVILIFFVIKNKFSFKVGKSKLGLILLSILSIIPIIYNPYVADYNEFALYLLFFNWALYLLVYLIFCNLLKENALKILTISLCLLGILLTYQCLSTVIKVYGFPLTFKDYWYYIGWGLCNEAGIMICFVMPFIFINFQQGNKLEKAISIFIFLISIFGILITSSRGAILIGGLEVMALGLALVFFNRKKRITWILIGIFLFFTLTIGIVFLSEIKSFVNKVFYDGISLNGRESLYNQAIDLFTANPLNIIFGNGIITAPDNNGKYVVFHSTFFQTLATMGILGVISLCIHLLQKYKSICGKNSFYVFMIIGYIAVDIYGMIDNTYHMYYYMLVLMIVMATIDTYQNNLKEKKNLSINKTGI